MFIPWLFLVGSSRGLEGLLFSPLSLSSEESRLLREGDIVLQAGQGWIPALIQAVLQEPLPLTHAAVLVLEDDVWHVVQATDPQLTGLEPVHRVPLQTLLNTTKPESLIVVRPRLNAKHLAAFLDIVKKSPSQQFRFDHAYDWQTDEAVYCSELVAKCLLQSGMEELADRLLFRGPILLFSTFLQTDLFQPILSKNPHYLVEAPASP